MRKTNHGISVLCALVFVATPAIIGFSFLLPDGRPSVSYPLGFYGVVGIGFVFYVVLFSLIMGYSKILTIDIFTFYIPLSLVFMSIFVSFSGHAALRFLLVIAMIIVAGPLNVLVARYKEKYRQKILKNNKKHRK